MIRALCLNPAIDRSYMIDAFETGRQYRDNTPRLSVGGKGIYVARACALLGELVTVYGFIGGVNGRLVAEETRRCGCINRFIEVEGETRVTINIIDNALKRETEIIERGVSVSEDDVRRLMEALAADVAAGDLVICSGILIGGVPDDIYSRVSRLCEAAGAKCFLDSNGDHLQQSIGGRYHLFKPNRNELLAMFAAEDTRDLDAIGRLARQALSSGMESVLVSLGRNGALFVTENVCYKIGVPVVTVDSTIGCGDCTVAGFAVGVSRGLTVPDTLRLAAACGVANAASPGICDFSLMDMEIYYSQVTLHPVMLG